MLCYKSWTPLSKKVGKVIVVDVCNDFAPDTFAPEEGDGIDWTLVCTTCYWHKDDHKKVGK
jgi:hypothetical protein